MTTGTVFDYQAIDPSGKIVTGQIQARSMREAQRTIETRNLVPVELTAARAQARRRGKLFQRPPTMREYALLMEQMALLLTAGIPLLNAVKSLQTQSIHPAFEQSLTDLDARLRAGEALASSLKVAFPALPSYFHQLAAAGEATGRLGTALKDGVAQLNYDIAIAQDIRNALTYPAILAFTGIAAVTFIFIVVVPRFSSMLKGKLDQLPFISKMVIEIGMAAQAAKVPIFIVASLAIAGMVWLARNPAFRLRLRQWADRVPLVGPWLLESDIARWSAMLSTMLANGVDLIQSLAFAREAITLERFHQRLGQVTKSVRAGQSLSAATASQDIFTATAIGLIQVGESSGNLAALLRTMADLYENSGRQRMKRLLIMLEPIAILLIGGVIGGIVAAIMLAITSINQVVL
ncbi:MAG: type II secretion system F family protein [Rhodospirillaceae bacterium]|nr:type II secretion system F family protein [Rhodospirillaceae bacterium]